MTNCDVVVVGGGIAGISAAALLAGRGVEVVLLEAEPTLAYPPPADQLQYLENYGNDTVRRLTLATGARAVPGARPPQRRACWPVAQLKAEVEHAKDRPVDRIR